MAWNQYLYDFDDAIISSDKQFDKSSLFDCQIQPMQVCRICSVLGHPTKMCPMLQEESYEQINATSVFLGQPQANYDSCSNTHNSEWRDHNTLAYGNTQMHWHEYNAPDYQQFNQPYPISPQQGQSSISDMSLEDMFKSFMTNTLQFQQETNAIIQNLNTQVERLTDAISQLKEQSADELPYHTVIDQTDDESEIVLDSGNEVKPLAPIASPLQIQEDADNISKDEDIINVDDDVICGYDLPKMEENFDQTDKKLEDAINTSLGLNAEEIKQNQELTKAKAELNSLPVILNTNAILSIQLPVTHTNSFILQVPIPKLKSLSIYLQYILLGLGRKPSYELQMRSNLPMKDNVMDGILKIQEVGVT